MKTPYSLFLLLIVLSGAAQTPSASQPVSVTVDASKAAPPISPYVYGQFIEHAGSLIYSSFWSEMLDDRKFYYAVMPKPAEDPNAGQRAPGGFGPGRRRNVGPGRWNPIGPVDSVVMDTNRPFVGDHTPLLKLAGSEPRGIRQTGITFVQGAADNDRIRLAGDLTAKIYRDHFGSVPVDVSGNSPQPKPTDPPGGEQPVINAGSDTFPLDVVAARTHDRRTLTVAVLNPTNVEQPLKLGITGANLFGKGALWRLATTAENGQDPSISNSLLESLSAEFTVPRFSVNIYELATAP